MCTVICVSTYFNKQEIPMFENSETHFTGFFPNARGQPNGSGSSPAGPDRIPPESGFRAGWERHPRNTALTVCQGSAVTLSNNNRRWHLLVLHHEDAARRARASHVLGERWVRGRRATAEQKGRRRAPSAGHELVRAARPAPRGRGTRLRPHFVNCHLKRSLSRRLYFFPVRHYCMYMQY